jgi:hypothetical protein
MGILFVCTTFFGIIWTFSYVQLACLDECLDGIAVQVCWTTALHGHGKNTMPATRE